MTKDKKKQKFNIIIIKLDRTQQGHDVSDTATCECSIDGDEYVAEVEFYVDGQKYTWSDRYSCDVSIEDIKKDVIGYIPHTIKHLLKRL